MTALTRTVPAFVPPVTAAPTLAMRGVSKVFGDGDSQVTALHPTDFEVYPGELVAVIGPSGSGKSTFLTLAGALQIPTDGSVTIAGQELSRLNPRQLADFRLHHIGFVLQASNLIPYLNVREQLTLVPGLAGRGGAQARTLADELLGSLGLAERAGHYPQQLSGGQKQRVAIARALMNDPQLILADEPTAALDGVRGREVVTMLAREVRERGKAAVMVTHDERVLDLCTRVVRLEDGHVTGAGTAQELAAD
ncbi:Phosphonate-transporting ATPase [Deinococcus proteolyticus MRP]|uniref:Putative hemin import ATP-binding protein HrtA n=1 Tax=Deinococcus proteolyticus (strain ATCC 35074 / DSM 20540 / JCM 6276 / NBRC 101906 / NCIMB 13154 / VKM Ac-1939 / CCM 2703 / MRP) TaxID=693977 RepID=F0RL84_DEIPM|nr:ABC transporter ATP-binding protein [Deinococcus proteolyticus]ADY26876.1 Phosphonate-transporting ATPase [Deinococcus proteolyticus MRP]